MLSINLYSCQNVMHNNSSAREEWLSWTDTTFGGVVRVKFVWEFALTIVGWPPLWDLTRGWNWKGN